MKTQPLILASSSPYRKQLLEKLGFDFICAAPDIDEKMRANESAKSLALRLAHEKAQALAVRYPTQLIIASDQVAILDNQQLEKPGTPANAIQQLQNSSGKIVDFHTSICVLNSATQEIKSSIDLCRVHFKTLSQQEIINYVQREQPYDCAGSFKSEGLGIALFERIEGDDPNALIGLPLIQLISLLTDFGISVL